MFDSLTKKILPAIIIFALILSSISVFVFIPKSTLGMSTSTNYKITSSDINVGGTENQTSTNYKMSETIGGFATGISESTLYKLKAGYRQMSADYYLAISSPSDISLSPSIPGMTGNLGSPSTGEVTWNVITDNPAGFSKSIKATTTPSLRLDDNNYFSDYSPSNPVVPDFLWTSPTSSEAYFGFTVEPATVADTVQSFRDDGAANCNTGSNNTSDRCWFGLNGTSDITIINRTSRTDELGENEKIKFRAESNAKFLRSGDYQAIITVTVVAN